MAYLFEVRVSKERGGVPHKVVSVEKLLGRFDEGSEFTTGDFKKTKNLFTKKCAHCNKNFKAIHKSMKFCVKEDVPLKDQCRAKAELKKRQQKRLLLPVAKCALCKKEFQPLRAKHILCNQPCNTALVRKGVNQVRVYKCKTCRKDFRTTKKNAFVYCGNPCSYVLYYREQKKQKTLDRHKNQKCKLCGKIIVGAKRARIVCHDPCILTRSVKKKLILEGKLP